MQNQIPVGVIDGLADLEEQTEARLDSQLAII